MNAPLPAHLLPKIEPRAVPPEMVEALKAQFGERCSTALVVREQHGRDAPSPSSAIRPCSSRTVPAGVRLTLPLLRSSNDTPSFRSSLPIATRCR